MSDRTWLTLFILKHPIWTLKEIIDWYKGLKNEL